MIKKIAHTIYFYWLQICYQKVENKTLTTFGPLYIFVPKIELKNTNITIYSRGVLLKCFSITKDILFSECVFVDGNFQRTSFDKTQGE